MNPKAEWKLVKSLGGIPAAHVRVSDDGAEAEATFAMHELADPYFVRQRIYDLWNSLLERRLDIHDERYRVLSAASAEG